MNENDLAKEINQLEKSIVSSWYNKNITNENEREQLWKNIIIADTKKAVRKVMNLRILTTDSELDKKCKELVIDLKNYYKSLAF